MSLPLATLSRHATRVVLNDTFTYATERPARGGGGAKRVEFRGPQDAESYLRFWAGDAAAMALLRNALCRYRGGWIDPLSNEAVIHALASHLARGDMVVSAENVIFLPSLVGVVMPRAARRAAASAARRRAATLAPPPPPVPLLPQLEEVQIEGAMVLPEVMQTLEQLDVTLGEIGSVTASLEPAPSGVPPIQAALSEASGSITSTLDEL